MKVAFDVKGTLDGNNQDNVRKLLKWFVSKGAEVTVWSNSYGYAKEMGDQLGLPADSKRCTWDYDCTENPQENYFDYAIEDDRSQTYLAAKKFIWVDEITDECKFESLL